MKSCELSDNKMYEIEDYSKFIECLKSKAKEKLENEEGEQNDDALAEYIAGKIGVEMNTVESWLENKCKPKQFNLELLITEFELVLQEAGIVIKHKGDSEIKKQIGERIRNLLNERGIKQVELARAIEESTQKVSKWCKGINIPNEEVLKKIADFFGVSLDYLLTGEIIERDIEIETGLNKETIDKLKKIKKEKEISEKNKLFKDTTGNQYIVDITEIDILNCIVSETDLLEYLKLAFQDYIRLYKDMQEYEKKYNKAKYKDKDGAKAMREKNNTEKRHILENMSDKVKQEFEGFCKKYSDKLQ